MMNVKDGVSAKNGQCPFVLFCLFLILSKEPMCARKLPPCGTGQVEYLGGVRIGVLTKCRFWRAFLFVLFAL